MKTKYALLAVAIIAALSATLHAQANKQGVVTPLSSVKFASDGQPPCLLAALENGDPDTGPSTFILKAPSGCDVTWHYHTAEEQLIVTQGSVEAEMGDMPKAVLTSGSFAMMGSKMKHRFACRSKEDCIMFVTFDRKYDIVWINGNSSSATGNSNK